MALIGVLQPFAPVQAGIAEYRFPGASELVREVGMDWMSQDLALVCLPAQLRGLVQDF